MNKKRKYSQLSIKPIEYLYCQVCYTAVKDYKECVNHWVYCCSDCFAILYLQNYGKFGNEESTFSNEMNIEDKPIGIIPPINMEE